MKNNFTEPACSRKTVGFVQRYKKQIRFVMRVSFFNMILLSMSLLIKANGVTGQNIDEVYVTIEAKNESLKTVLERISEKTHLQISYLSKQVEPYDNINLILAERSVKDILDFALEGTSLTYKQADNYVYIEKADKEGRDLIAASSLIKEVFLFTTVSGTVVDLNKMPIAGVNIIVKGTATGTTTDVEGKYFISANDSDILVFTFIGFKTYEIEVAGRAVIDVSLEEDIKALQEVEVNAGYWKVDKHEKTGNISKITATEIGKQTILNPLQSLQGRVPGVYVQQKTGIPGGGFDVQIRGQNSLRNTPFDNGNLPLYIVDGVPFTSSPFATLSGSASVLGGGVVGVGNPLNSLNPADIESIEILKDADATSIYGARGANGVVLITTKKGSVGKSNVDINFYQGIGKVNNMMDLLNSKQYLEMRNEAFANDGINPQINDYDVNGTWDTTRYTDWQKLLIGGTANVTNLQTTVSGGTPNIQFLIGTGYYRETTVFPGDFDYNKVSSNFNINHGSSNNKFNVRLSGNFVIENKDLPRLDPTSTALSLPPVAPAIFDQQGNLNWEEGTWDNPFASFQHAYNTRTTNLISNAVVSYKVLDGLEVKGSLGYTESRINENETVPIASRSPFSSITTGSSDFADAMIRSWIIEPQLSYQKVINSGKFNLMAGVTFQENRSHAQTISATGFNSDALLDNIRAAPNLFVRSFNSTQYRYKAVFGRINYNWREKYIINLTGRRDGSSRFGPGNQFAYFGAIGAAWIFSKEGFIQNTLSVLNFGKLRLSYGTTGSDQIGDYRYFELWSPTSFPYDGIAAISPDNLFNADFSWEVNRKLEIAIELGLIDDRIFLSACYYRNKSDNQLIGTSLPATTGFASYQANFPAEVINTGLEMELSTLNVKTRHFSWSTAINITIPRNKLTAFPSIENSSFAFIYEVGKSLGVQRTYHYTGISPNTGEYAFEDINEDGGINFNDQQFLEEISQSYFGGFQTSFQYKGFELEFLLQFVKQTGRDYFSYPSFGTSPGTFSNQPSIVLSRWQQPNDITNIQRYTQAGLARTAHGYAKSSDYAISDVSYIRLRNVSLSYRFPLSIARKIKLENLKIYMQGQNLLTFTEYIGLDPETQAASLPPLRMLTFGLQFTF